MTLTVSSVNNQYVVGGITRDPSVTAPLGRAYYQVGPHLLGFDDNFAEPVIVRAYYDPAQDPQAALALARNTVQYAGYVQFMQLSFRGMPIPPDVYGGKLADRVPYVYGRDKKFLDFMGPADARVRGVLTPFYPYNALLATSITDNATFFQHPQLNGSLWSPANLGTTQSLAASLYGEISPGLVTPADLARVLTPDNQILVLSPTPQQLAQTEAYRLALNALETTPQGNPPLAQLDESQVAAQIIGDYVLLTLPDPEELGDTLVISTATRTDGGTNVIVNLLDDYEMADLFYNAGRLALWRIRQYQIDQGVVDSEDLPQAAGRGRSGLYTPPFQFEPGEYAIQLKYWTAAVAVEQTRQQLYRTLLSGITWSALFQFDEDTGLMNFSTIKQPSLFDGYTVMDGFRAFETSLQSPRTANALIDTRNFTKAAMVRDNFAGGSKLAFIN